MWRARCGQFLAMVVMIVLFPKMAHAHSGPIVFHAVIVLVAQLFVGPAIIFLAKMFAGQRRRYFIAFFLGVVCSWAFVFLGLGIVETAFDALTEGLSVSTVVTLSAIFFYTHFLGIPLAALAVVWAAYALRKKYLP